MNVKVNKIGGHKLLENSLVDGVSQSEKMGQIVADEFVIGYNL